MQHKKKINHDQTEERNRNKTWTTFTYYSPKVRKTNLFKNTNVVIPSRTHTPYNSSQSKKQITKHQNTTRVESTKFHATLAIDRILGRQVAA